MAMESLIKDLTAALNEFKAALTVAYACTCTWDPDDDQHADTCPRELRLRDKEAQWV